MSVRADITDNIVTTLEGITIAAGYTFDMGEVSKERHQWADWGANELWPKVSLSTGSELAIPRIGNNIYDFQWSLPIRVFYKGDDSGEVISDIMYDIRNALLRRNSLHRGGYAWNTCFKGSETLEDTFEEDRRAVAIEMNFMIEYREVYD